MVNEKAKKVFQKIDHSAIYLLIAGTYTPILLLTVDYPLSVALLAITWYLSLTGIVYSCLTVKFKYLSGYPIIQYNLAKVLFHKLNIEKIIDIFLFTFLGLLSTLSFISKNPFCLFVFGFVVS